MYSISTVLYCTVSISSSGLLYLQTKAGYQYNHRVLLCTVTVSDRRCTHNKSQRGARVGYINGGAAGRARVSCACLERNRVVRRLRVLDGRSNIDAPPASAGHGGVRARAVSDGKTASPWHSAPRKYKLAPLDNWRVCKCTRFPSISTFVVEIECSFSENLKRGNLLACCWQHIGNVVGHRLRQGRPRARVAGRRRHRLDHTLRAIDLPLPRA